VNLSESHIRKSDPILLDQLTHAREGEMLRVAMTLNAESSEIGQNMTLPTLDPAQFPTRTDYRKALIQQQQARLAKALSSTIQDLQNLSLKTYGGNTSRVIIAEGTAEQIMKSLELTGVHHASFDQSIRIAPNPPSDEIVKSAKYLSQIATDVFGINANENTPDYRSINQAFEKYAGKYKTRYCLLRILGMKKSINLESVYTDVRLLYGMDIIQFESKKEVEKAYREQPTIRFQKTYARKQDGIKIANQEKFLVVLGAPGSGKSTFLRRIGLEALNQGSQFFKHRCIPILIELKHLNKYDIDLEEFIANEFQECGFPHARNFIQNALGQGKMLVLLDGLDEVPTKNLNGTIKKIQDFGRQYPQNRYIFSCRTAFYQQTFTGFTNVTMAEFEDDQIQQFINNWFQSEVDQQANTAERCWKALQEAERSGAKELAHTPLLLTFLCLVYDRSQTFPTNRSFLYRKALRILMEEWAAEKRILQDAIYAGLSTDLEEILLSEIAVSGFENDQIFFSHSELIEKIKNFLTNNLNAPDELDGSEVLNAIVVQQGILVERVKDSYSFSHLTLQEYLAAQYINDHNCIGRLVNEHLIDRRWREMFLLVAGIMRGGADELLLMMEKQTQSYIEPKNIKKPRYPISLFFNSQPLNVGKLQNLLQWADWITSGSEGDYKPVVKRTEAIILGISLSRALERTRFLERSRGLERTNNTERINALKHVRAIDRTSSRVLECIVSFSRTILTHNISSDFFLNLEFDLNIASYYERTQIFQPGTYTNLIRNLEIFYPNGSGKSENGQKRHILFAEHIRHLWFEALQLEPEMLNLSAEEILELESYFYSYELIVQCKESAVSVSSQTWSKIEDRMLTATM
jgi:NACHT domain